MEYSLLRTLIVLLVVSCWGVSGADWGYSGSHGPSHWKEDYPACDLSRQSPVNIDTDSTVYEDLGQLKFTGLDSAPTNTNLTLFNNNHTIQINFRDASTDGVSQDMSVEDGGLPFKGYLFQLHLHWGSDNANGSEHTIDQDPRSGEIHFVFINEEFSTAPEALADPEGLAVVGVFIGVGGSNNDNFDIFLNSFDEINNGQGIQIAPFVVNSLFPSNTDEFYRYLGSLTTPPCSEAVVWTVLNNGIQISQTQMNKLRDYMSGGGYSLSDNFRPTQALRTRTINRSFDPDPSRAQISVTSLSVIGLSVISMLVTLIK